MPANQESFPSQNTEADDQNQEYSPDKLEGVDEAAASATSVLESSIEGKRHIGVSDTERGLRGIVEAPTPGGSVTGLFDGNKLDQIKITLHSEDGTEHIVEIDKPESETPRINLDNTPATAVDMPSVVAVINQIKADRKAMQENDEEQPESEDIEERGDKDDHEGHRIAA